MQQRIKIGRSSDNDIVIENKHISREHAVFIINEDSIILEDLNSTNGTYVNGHKVKLARIEINDNIQFGKSYIFDWTLINANNHEKNSNKPQIKRTYPKQKIRIGRDLKNDIVIDNIRISREHALLDNNNGHWIIKDLNSLNGVFVNGKKIKQSIVNDSDRISLGGILIPLSDLINKNIKKNIGIKIEVDSINFSINNKEIINDVSLTLQPGEFIGLIGESGSGKTTLLTLLNGYLKPNKGTVYYDSIPYLENINEFKGLTGYVPQEDIIHKELTVTESLNFSAEIRFDGKLLKSDIQNQVRKIINTLNLKESSDTIIGDSEKKGISGGQRKRVNLGQELISEPSVLFLDEPTSGLDPRSDSEVMDLLKSLTNQGKTVLLTTHNINKENFSKFTHLILMAKGGRLAYFGKSEEIYKYFDINDPIRIFDKLKEKDSKYWQDRFKKSDIYKKYVTDRINEKYSAKNTNHKDYKIDTHFSISQFYSLIKRNTIIKLRDNVSLMILLMQAPIIALLISIVFSRPDQTTEALFVLVIAAIWLGCSNSAREIVSEQTIFKRERKVGLNINSYLLSKYIILSALCFIQCLILTLISTLFLNINSIVPLFIILLLTSISSLSLGLFVSSLSKTSETAIALIPIILIPQVVLGGLISLFARMTDIVKALASIMTSRWAFEAVLINHYGTSQEIRTIGFNTEFLWLDILVLLIFGLAMYFATSFVLNRKDKININ